MFNNKVLTTAAILIALLGFATVQMRAEIPIVQADTIYKGFPGGEVSGIVFGPTGETVIVMHDAQPVEINIKTKQIVREFEKVPNGNGEQSLLFIDKIKNYIGGTFFSTDYFGEKNISGEILWDLQTGKILKSIPHVILIIDGIKYYSKTVSNLYRYDINMFKMVDSFSLSSIQSYNAEWRACGIVPNSNKVLVGVQRYKENEQGKRTYLLSELYLLDFDTKKYKKIPIPYEAGQKSSEITNITVSETGKYNIVTIQDIPGSRNYYFFDKDLNFIYKENESNLKEKLTANKFYFDNNPLIINDEYLLMRYMIEKQSITEYNTMIYDINMRNMKKIINFYSGGYFDFNNPTFILSNHFGCLATFTIDDVSVLSDGFYKDASIVYKKHYFEYDSNKSFIGSINIYDTLGKVMVYLGTQNFSEGKNIVSMNQPLQKGVYIIMIKYGSEQISNKFVVE